MIAKRTDPWLSATLLALSVAALGRALQLGDGLLAAGTILWLTISFVACIAAVLVVRHPLPWRKGHALLVTALSLALAWQALQLLTSSPFSGDVAPTAEWLSTFRIGVAGALLAGAATLLAGPTLRHAAFIALLGIYCTLGVSIIHAVPVPQIDVYVFQRDATDALLRSTNPYAITFPDIYEPGSPWYAPGMSVDGRLQFGYPYLPLSLLLTIPGHLLGDYRYAMLLAMLLSAALIAYIRPRVIGFAAALLLLLQPRGMYVLERGWTEPLTVLLLSTTVFTAVRFPRLTPWTLGLLLVTKQYMPFILGVTTLLIRAPVHWRDATTMFVRAAVAAAVVTVPFVLWDVSGFWESAVMLQFHQPFRWDALSYVAWWNAGSRDGAAPPLWIPFAALLAATAVALWRCRHTVAGFAAAVALVLFAFFVFNKQAFANYYYLVIGAMCSAIAGVTTGSTSAAEEA